jgi:hypothetical protein
MTGPQDVIDLARRGVAPPDWHVFTKRRGVVGAFFRGTSGHPDPMLAITPEAAVEYVSDKVSSAILPFGLVAEAKLRARARPRRAARTPARTPPRTHPAHLGGRGAHRRPQG